ncbi:SRPBCC family protein [Hoeflea ulvae]|uniref:SRPBCC domain-containing protein n=1 Tax=Hoeflea ulvae TaxID=2983764 RepID=A0ABT3YBB1_9HYPH|nr:SRPBCC domain-containing protein [Hoeflea ulvae]MCY0093151.1 SRPBCC domain-containing protein [Hoeflea ulvae]
MTETLNELELTVSRKIPVPRQKVFDAWLSPRMMEKFMRPGGSDMTSTATNDPVKGGRFSIIMQDAGKNIPHAGTYLEIDPHSRLAFTWESPHSLDDSVVTIDFAELGPSLTEIRLHQVKFRSEAARDGHISGWTAIFEALEETLG